MCMLAIQRLRLLENLLAALSGAAVVHGPSAWRRCICAKLYYCLMMSLVYLACEKKPRKQKSRIGSLKWLKTSYRIPFPRVCLQTVCFHR